ncbi:hypothetical protein A143_07120 [Vibrio splendidus ZS-139]|nr:hypothetical protein A143_07120 [Vibrio splendidus ZS-139]
MSVSLNLEGIKVHLDQLMLDPNNYRLTYDAVEVVHEDDEVIGIQSEIERKLAKEKLGDLIDSIVENGFLEVDRIVVRKLEGESDKYLVIEGNRRTAALKSLYRDHKEGFIELSHSLMDKIKAINVLLIAGGTQEEITDYQHTLMGVRHVSGPKKWTGMQSAKLVCDLVKQDNSPSQIGALLGISAIEANRRMRGYLAYKQLSDDQRYGKYVKSKHYALLLEFVSKKEVRDWLEWSDDKQIISEKSQNILYSHIVKTSNALEVEIKNPTQAREFCKALTIPKFRTLINKNVPLSKLGPITESIEEQDREIKNFSVFLNSIKVEELSSKNRSTLETISKKIRSLLEKEY